MKELKMPSSDLRSKILNKVGFENRFIGYRLSRSGYSMVTCYQFEDVVKLLKMKSGSKISKISRVNFHGLEKWLREVIEDNELADRVSRAAKESKGEYFAAIAAGDLMENRLIQCKKLQGEV